MKTASNWICRAFALAMLAVCCGCQSEPEYIIVEDINPNTGEVDRFYVKAGGVEGDPKTWNTDEPPKKSDDLPPPGKRVVYRK